MVWRSFFHNFAWLFRFCYLVGGYRAHNMSITGCAYSQRAQLLVTCSADSEGKIHKRAPKYLKIIIFKLDVAYLVYCRIATGFRILLFN